MKTNNEIIRTEDLKRSFNKEDNRVDVLKGVNMTINEGEFVTIMGKSGSGKTTLLKLISLLDKPSGGKVFFKGKNASTIRGDKLAELRRCHVGFVYQDYYLMDSLSVMGNIMLPKVLGRIGVDECLNETKKIAKIMGIESLLEKRSTELSGGEKQRVSICRALLNEPDVIFADEPTGNLDTATIESVMSYFKMINETFEKTVVMITHDPAVASYSDRVLFLKDGVIESELVKEESNETFYDRVVLEQKRILTGR